MPDNQIKHCLIRADASSKIGTGHIYRNLNLAICLSENGYKVSFISRGLSNSLRRMIKDKGIDILELEVGPVSLEVSNAHCPHAEWLDVPYQQEIENSYILCQEYCKNNAIESIDWVIIDHYAIDYQWHSVIKGISQFILQIDDLADRKHACDILVDQNYYINMSERYTTLVPATARLLLGPKYAILNKDFSRYRASLQPYEQRLEGKKIVVFFGGIDQINETEKAIEGLLTIIDKDVTLDVIVGSNNPHKERLISLYSCTDNISISVQVSDMARRLSEAFLFVGAVGTATWERCSLSLPGIVVSVAKNQVELAESLAYIKSHLYLGSADVTQYSDYTNAYELLFNEKLRLIEQSMISGQLSDGMGANKILLEMQNRYANQ